MQAIFYKIAAIIFPVLGVIFCGYLYGRSRPRAAREQFATIGPFIMDFLTPLMIFGAMSQKSFDIYANVPLIEATVWVVTGCAALSALVAKSLHIDPKTLVPAMMYSNCGNMGLPLAMLAFGAAGFAQATVLFLVCNLMYYSFGVWLLSGGRLSLKLLNTPIMWSMICGVAFALLHLHMPEMLQQMFMFLTNTAITMMMLALGVRLLDIDWRQTHIGILGGVLCPVSSLIFAWLLIHFNLLHLTTDQAAQVYLFASLPPAVSCFMMADFYKQEPAKVAAMVLIGNVLSLVFVPIGLALALGLLS